MWPRSNGFRCKAGTRSSRSTCRRSSMAHAWRCWHAHAQLGRIINIASVHGLVGSTGKAAYGRQAWRSGPDQGRGPGNRHQPCHRNAICPGWVLTPLVQQQIDDRAANGGDALQAQHDLLAEKQPSLAFVTRSTWASLCFSCAAKRVARCVVPPGTLTGLVGPVTQAPAVVGTGFAGVCRRTAAGRCAISGAIAPPTGLGERPQTRSNQA